MCSNHRSSYKNRISNAIFSLIIHFSSNKSVKCKLIRRCSHRCLVSQWSSLSIKFWISLMKCYQLSRMMSQFQICIIHLVTMKLGGIQTRRNKWPSLSKDRRHQIAAISKKRHPQSSTGWRMDSILEKSSRKIQRNRASERIVWTI